MKNNLNFQKNLYFILIILLGTSYFSLVISLAYSIINACVSQFIRVAGFNFNELSLAVLDSSLYVYFMGIGVLSLLLTKILWGAFKTYIKYKRTDIFLRKFEFIEYSDCNILNTDEKHAFTAGFISPKVFISQGLIESVSSEELNAIKHHEYSHARSFDPLKLTITEFVENILVWFPYRRTIFSQFKLLIELSADQNAIEGARKRDIVSALYKMVGGSEIYQVGFSSQSERVNVLVGNSVFNSLKSFSYAFLSLVILLSMVGFIQNKKPFDLCEGVENCFVEEYLQSNEFSSDVSCIEHVVYKNYSPARQSIY